MRALVPASSAEDPLTPDLLHPIAAASLDRRAASRTLEFAFTAGDAAGLAGGALSTAAVADSSWDPASFADELFLGPLVESVLSFDVEGRRARLDRSFLRRLLTQPPRDLATTRFRQDVFRELEAEPVMLEGLRAAYARVSAILLALDEGESDTRFGLPRWRLDLLRDIRGLFDALHGPFAGARSGLSRLHAFAKHVHASEGHARLCALLDFEGDMASVELRLRLGVDGRVRELTTLATRERPDSVFYRGPLSRLWTRISNALRGYQLSESVLVERWFDHVFAGIVEFLPAMLQLRGDLEFYLAGFQLRALAERRGLAVCLPALHEDAPPGDGAAPPHKHLRGLFNPLLLLQARPPVPCDLGIDSFRRTCILTGPNSGGKTRLLQAIALAQMFAQAGMFVPAAEAVLRPASGMFVSLAQPSRADAEEGRLGTELLRIRRLFEAARPCCLIVLDELCSGTNPSEGEEIFHLVVDLLRELQPEVFITTHFLQFAARLAEQPDALSLCFLQVELDADRAPTFQFVPGVATTSLAHQTAQRLGVSREELLALIRRRR